MELTPITETEFRKKNKRLWDKILFQNPQNRIKSSSWILSKKKTKKKH